MSTIRWGVLSTAKIGTEKVIPAIQNGGNCEVIAIASRDRGRARRVADNLQIPDAYGSYEELLAVDDIDAVYIPLPNHLHAEWTKAAARAGKHVLCEKPLALSAAEAQTMVDVCSTEGVKFMEAFMYRLHPSWTKVRDLIRSEAIGELRAVQVRFSYFNDDPDNIRNIAAFGGGALMDIGCYPINVARMLFDALRGRHTDLGDTRIRTGSGEFRVFHSDRTGPARTPARNEGKNRSRYPLQYPTG